MKLKNIDFESFVFGQSGVQGFFGEGDEYPHHKWYKKFLGKHGFSFDGMSFTAKTFTLDSLIYPNSSNTEMVDYYKVKHFFPASIWWSPLSVWKGYLVNAMGLPNPGAMIMLRHDKWQRRRDVFQISISLMKGTLIEKINEAKEICKLLKFYMPLGILHRYALQINFSCPNTGHEQLQVEKEIIEILKTFRMLLPGIVLIPKFDPFVEPMTIKRLKSYCDAFCIGNTIALEKQQHTSWIKKFFRNGISPLVEQLKRKSEGKIKKDFHGGLSGAPLFPILVNWLTRMEACDPTVSIIAGGGIMRKKNITRLSEFKIVKGVALGSVAILRPWRLQGMIDHGNEIFTKREKYSSSI